MNVASSPMPATPQQHNKAPSTKASPSHDASPNSLSISPSFSDFALERCGLNNFLQFDLQAECDEGSSDLTANTIDRVSSILLPPKLNHSSRAGRPDQFGLETIKNRQHALSKDLHTMVLAALREASQEVGEDTIGSVRLDEIANELDNMASSSSSSHHHNPIILPRGSSLTNVLTESLEEAVNITDVPWGDDETSSCGSSLDSLKYYKVRSRRNFGNE